MNAPEAIAKAVPSAARRMSAAQYRQSLRRLNPVVYVDSRRIESVADEPALMPGMRALGVSYDMALDPVLAPLMLATTATGKTVPRSCQHTGCAQRYLVHDGLNALAQASATTTSR